MLKEFREFAVKGNVIDLAVGVIIGTAFGKIVSSLVADVVMPPIGILLDGVDFSDLTLTLKQATEEAAAVELRYGLFINNVIDFLIIAFVVFLMVKQINRLKKQEEKKEQKQEKKAEPAEDILLLREIRDSLKSKK